MGILFSALFSFFQPGHIFVF